MARPKAVPGVRACAQAYGNWYCVLLLPSFLTYTITMVGEFDRIPFDLPEGEAELVGGCRTPPVSVPPAPAPAPAASSGGRRTACRQDGGN